MGAFATAVGGQVGTTATINAVGDKLSQVIDSAGKIFGAKYASKVTINETQQKSKTMRTIVIAAGGVLVTGLLAFLIIRKK
jgi:DNA-binding transcriptional regulator LsrR (DeoR family)